MRPRARPALSSRAVESRMKAQRTSTGSQRSRRSRLLQMRQVPHTQQQTRPRHSFTHCQSNEAPGAQDTPAPRNASHRTRRRRSKRCKRHGCRGQRRNNEGDTHPQHTRIRKGHAVAAHSCAKERCIWQRIGRRSSKVGRRRSKVWHVAAGTTGHRMCLVLSPAARSTHTYTSDEGRVGREEHAVACCAKDGAWCSG